MFNLNTPERKGKGLYSSQAPSTTPAGPPPSWLTNKSTTPAGPPPRSSRIFGSSATGPPNTFARRTTPARKTFAVPESSPLGNEDDDDDADGETEDEMYKSPTKEVLTRSMIESPRGLKRSRNGKVREQTDSDISSIARAIARDSPLAELEEADDLVLETEEIVSQLDRDVRETSSIEDLTDGVVRLSKLWAKSSDLKSRNGAVGPQSTDAVTNTNYIISLLLQMHHPHAIKPTTTPSNFKPQRSLALTKPGHAPPIHLPRALLDWLDTYHNPFPDDFDAIHRFQPSPSAHETFWDIVFVELARGRVQRAIRLLKDAGWEYALTAEDDGNGDAGYHGRQLENTEEVVARCVRVLESCPAITHHDWDIKNADWEVFRGRLRQATRDLEAFAHDDRANREESFAQQPSENFFALSQQDGAGSMSAASMRAGSRVPWTIYENVKNVYGLLLGQDELLDTTQDWLEGAILLTVWWDGSDGAADPRASFGRSNLRKSTRAGIREVDVAPLVAYRKRLGEVFRVVTSEMEEAVFQPDTLDSVHVALASVMEDRVEDVIGILRTWSQTLSSAVVEVAAMGGWLPQSRPKGRSLMDEAGFSSEDLMILSHGPGQHAPPVNDASRDNVLGDYADLLAGKEIFTSSDGKIEREGWELAVSVLGRQDDTNAAQSKISSLLDSLPVVDGVRVDRILVVCANMALSEQARGIAERYADGLSEDLQSIGSVLVYYARAHAAAKLKSTLALLVQLCLLQSTAVPTSTSLDPQLASLLSRERTALLQLSQVDAEAATLLASHLSGYAILRRFYELRDYDANQKADSSKTLGPLERMREAAKALIAVIGSASDCIRGGLFDPATESVVPVDGVLALLGEALPLLGHENRVFTRPQVYTLLRIVEDLDTAPGRIRENAGSLLRASMNAYRNRASDASASGVLKKSRSDISRSGEGLGGSSWDLLASSIMVTSMESGKAKQADMPRGWDWRKGLDAVVGAQVSNAEVLTLVRMALAQEVARGWSGAISR